MINNNKIKIILIGIILISVLSMIVYCSSTDPKIQEFIQNDNLEELEEYCNGLNGKSQRKCYVVLAEEYLNREDFMKAGELYEKAGKTNQAIKCYLVIYKKVEITKLNLSEEYVLISNLSEVNLSLEGWKLHDEENKNYYVFEEYVLNAGSILQMQSGKEEDRVDKIEDEYDYLLWSEKNIWNNSGDTAFLLDRFGNLISQLKCEE